MYMLISPVYTNALSIEEIKEEKIKIKEEISKKENMKIENISNKVNYDSLKNLINNNIFGEIFVDFFDKSPYTNYRKELELSEAVSRVYWTKSRTNFNDCFNRKEK